MGRRDEVIPRYRLYGLTVESPLPLPCPRAARTGRPDVSLRRGTDRQFARARTHDPAPRAAASWFRSCVLPDGATYLSWNGQFEFLIAPDAGPILYHRQPGASDESFRVYLAGQVLSYVLVARGVEALHGTAVLVDGEAVVFVGDCGYGKSTLGAALLGRGCPVVTDDLVALEPRRGRWRVCAGIPRLKLYPAVAGRLLRAADRGVPMNRGTAKLVLPLDAPRAASGTVPLRAVYVLADPAAQRACTDPRIEPLAGRSAFLEVIRAAFNLHVVDRNRLARQFRHAARLVAAVPVRRLTYPRAMRRLPVVCDAVFGDLARVRADRSLARRTRACRDARVFESGWKGGPARTGRASAPTVRR